MDAVTKPDKMAEDSDDEDLEALRLAALQSIKSKPTVIAPRRRPKPIGRPFRKRRGNFHQGRVNTNLISIVPLELPLDQAEPSKQSDPPPPLVLPQDRYCKTEVKEKQEEKKISVPSKFSRFEDSNSGDSEDEYEEDFLNQSSESEKPDESLDKNNKVDNESILDDDELLLQDEDSLGKFFNEFDSEINEDEPSRKTSKEKQDAKPSDGQDKNQSLESGSIKGGEKVIDKCLSLKDSKCALEEKRSNESQVPRLSKGDKSNTKDNMQDRSPQKEDDRRINRPCVYGRNRSPSPLSRGRTFDKYQQLPKRGGRNSPPRRKISPSAESLSPIGRRDLYQHKGPLPPAKSLHSSHYPSMSSSPHEVTPPHWGSRSDSSHGMGLSLGVSREWSSSPHKWPASNAPCSSINSPNKSMSPTRQRRRSRSPLHKGSRTWERDWSGSPQQKRSRDFDTPPGSQRSIGDGSKAIKRRSTSPISDRRDRSRSGHSKDRSYSPRVASPVNQHVHSPSKLPRRISPVRSSSRTPSLSPSPEPQGKSSSRRYKSPLRLPGYRVPNHRDNRIFRPDGKPNRKDNDRRAVRLNGPPRKGPESKVEVSKRPYNARLEVKVTEPSPPKKSEVERDVIPARSPNKGTVTNSWSSDEGQSDSESRFKGTESKIVKPVILSSKIMPVVPRTKEPEETSSSERRSPKKKKNKRSKKSFNKVKGIEVEDPEPKEKQTNDGDLRAELSRRRAERVNKEKNITQAMPVRLVQSALLSLTSKSNTVDGERNSANIYSSKSDVSTDSSVSKKKPIHSRLGLPVSRNPDPPESRLSAKCPLARVSDCDKEEASNVNVDGGNKWRKIKLKRNVTVQKKSLSRGTTSPVTNTSGKEQV